MDMDETVAPEPDLHTILFRAKKQPDQRLTEQIGIRDKPLEGRRKTVLPAPPISDCC
jgi:hypothetical protein